MIIGLGGEVARMGDLQILDATHGDGRVTLEVFSFWESKR